MGAYIRQLYCGSRLLCYFVCFVSVDFGELADNVENLPEYYKNSFIAIYEEKLQINLKDEYDISNTQESAGFE